MSQPLECHDHHYHHCDMAATTTITTTTTTTVIVIIPASTNIVDKLDLSSAIGKSTAVDPRFKGSKELQGQNHMSYF